MKIFMNVSSCSMKTTSLHWLLKSVLVFEFIISSQSFMEARNRNVVPPQTLIHNPDCANAAFLSKYKRSNTEPRTIALRRQGIQGGRFFP